MFPALSVNVCGVPLQTHFSPSKAMFILHVPVTFPVFLNVISTEKVSHGALSTIPGVQHGVNAIAWLLELAMLNLIRASSVAVSVSSIIAFFAILLSSNYKSEIGVF